MTESTPRTSTSSHTPPDTSSSDRVSADMALMKRAMKMMLRQPKALVLFLATSVAYGLFLSGFLFLLKNYLEVLFSNSIQSSDMAPIIRFSELIVLLGVGIALASYYRELSNMFITTKIRANVFTMLFGNMLRQSMRQYDDTSTGQTISTTLRDVNSIPAVNTELMRVIREPLVIIPILTGIVMDSWRLALIGMVAIPLVLWPLLALGKKIKKSMAKTRDAFGQMSDIILQVIEGIRIVKAYRSEDKVQENFGRINNRIFGQWMKYNRAMAMTRAVVEMVTVVGVVAVILLGGYMLIHTHLKVSSLITVVLAINLIYRPFKGMMTSYNQLQQHRSGLRRAFGILDQQPSITDAPDAKPLPPFSHSIRFEHVTFEYNPGQPVITDINFEIAKGESIGIVGPTGVGKSTIINLMTRFYDVTEGRVLIDGYDLKTVTFASIMDNIGLVTQVPFLFNVSIYENILYGRPDADAAAVHAAAKAANIHDEILKLPQGYDTPAGERGELLSGGQRQRISIARAILKNAPILLLDEATSSLDSASEKYVQDALDTMQKDHTSVIVAHRLSTLKNCDRIIVMNDGRLEAFDSHEKLLDISPTYRMLWYAQVPAEG